MKIEDILNILEKRFQKVADQDRKERMLDVLAKLRKETVSDRME